ncbi:hypothetical protein PENTCL1PPCAC_2096 [Pristionchus entomophagus]|uniref:Calx-beta domain-containing protein n=1 Tax=Pristionchus entomophagus TaxID=358040 RepID=A0AAV5S9T2_9BILA|nr:hypothetical protein PENTCL1PPCAC_2096 [Pristionchus entomophagus]
MTMKLLLPLILVSLQTSLSLSSYRGEDNDLSVTVVKISQRGSIPADSSLQNSENGGEKQCSVAKPCAPGLILPVWQPQHGLSSMEKAVRAVIYLFAMFYMFFGVSIVADRFMSAIEVITSQEKSVKMKKVNGEQYTILIRVWNETVSNLTLMALGSSAPEILLSVIEIFGNNFEAGDLGPSTIVGSAAFNLFIIIAICIWSIPSKEVRRIEHNDVFWVTAIWATFAYFWLYLILCFFSPNVIEVWEGLLTFLFFPLTVLSAYFMDQYSGSFGQRLFTGAINSFRRTDRRTPRSPIREFIKGDTNMENGNEDHRHSLLSQNIDPDAIAFEKHRREYLEVFRQLRAEHPDANVEDLEKLATERVVKDSKKSRAFYRIQATRKLVGSGDITQSKLKKKAKKLAESEVRKNDFVSIQFDPGHYMCLENVGDVKVRVVCDRGTTNPASTVTVRYKTVEDTANAGSDFIPVEGMLTFAEGETEKEISIGIVDNDIYEDDEQFMVKLSQCRAFSSSPPGEIPVRLGAAATATVLIVDDDHAGAFGFENEKYKVPESKGLFVVEVMRTRGARGAVSIPFKTVDGMAKAVKDYLPQEGELKFEDNQSSAEIRIEIINDDEYEKNEDFTIELGEPIWHRDEDDFKDEKEALEGRPVLSSIKRCKVIITEDKEFKSFVDKMLVNANTSLMVGTSSWKQQFEEAFNMDEDGDGEITTRERVMHFISLPWKLIFATIPPTDYANGWLCFVVAIFMIGLLTAVIGDLASHFGCTLGIKDAVTAISLVAMGTSIPDTFASRTAAMQDNTADSSIVNVTGSNAVNVFLGIGIAWAIAAIYHAINGTVFRVNAGSLAFSVTLFIMGSIICIGLLQYRRFNRRVGGELGGPMGCKIISVVIFFSVWIMYLLLSTLEAYCIISF